MDWILEKYHFGNFRQKITNRKRICELIIVLFFIFLYLLLKNSTIPQIEHQFTKSYRQIDWQRHIPERIKRVKKHEIPSPGAQNSETGQSSFDWAEFVDTDLLKNDVTSILNQQPQRSLLNIPDRINSRVMTYRLPSDETDPSLLIDTQKDYLKDNATQLIPSILVEPRDTGTTVAINDIMVNQSNIGSHRIYPSRKKTSITEDKIIPEAGVIEIPLISREKVSEKPDISVIIDQLMLWMKKHPYEFNHVVKSFMMYEKNDLTSKVVFRYKDRVFELYLLYKQKIKEIRICLIEANQSTMLIDSGFRKQSNYLRTGSVSRVEDDTIFSFSTSQYPASEKKTSEFYQFFLSWWEQAKKEK
ncbi:MAG: hypothetical protein JSW07_08900 [bacterium]|nr:MAG: hypothetical protein JSW07_08900 [bacterium]